MKISNIMNYCEMVFNLGVDTKEHQSHNKDTFQNKTKRDLHPKLNSITYTKISRFFRFSLKKEIKLYI